MDAAFTLLGMKIQPIRHAQILAQMNQWIGERTQGHCVVFANVYSVMQFQKLLPFRKAVQNADLVAPDGMPLVVVGRWRGFPLKQRADGPGLMTAALQYAEGSAWRHYFYGGAPATLHAMVKRLRAQSPTPQIAGSYSPPFRALTAEENQRVVEQINRSGADVLWVGLGSPKQEIWMWEHCDQLNVPVMLGVGQAFDLLAGAKKHAPDWMSNSGLEWLYRLAKEPRRLWKRYLIYNLWFIWLVLKEEVNLRLTTLHR